MGHVSGGLLFWQKSQREAGRAQTSVSKSPKGATLRTEI
ncbi:hypothetical protein AmDm5_0817 [Acetobacter malorum]|nr:hypothetical protein AmDm5_0817 [Acetobacter malorum]